MVSLHNRCIIIYIYRLWGETYEYPSFAPALLCWRCFCWLPMPRRRAYFTDDQLGRQSRSSRHRRQSGGAPASNAQSPCTDECH
ncbi:hypothetical protein KCP76_05705 [Salmonella enterica subsp. enterica serovar Weltevreden]|nr:hypothetical protein KCP76_05705 [Salmonella enterica subsp. enterica serovar Weltevreden]